MLNGNTSGNIYFPADSFDDIPTANLLGTWVVIPEPSTISLLGLGALALIRRRR